VNIVNNTEAFSAVFGMAFVIAAFYRVCQKF
jgi:hypothetical protein